METNDLRELPFNGLHVKNMAVLVVKIVLIIKLVKRSRLLLFRQGRTLLSDIPGEVLLPLTSVNKQCGIVRRSSGSIRWQVLKRRTLLQPRKPALLIA